MGDPAIDYDALAAALLKQWPERTLVVQLAPEPLMTKGELAAHLRVMPVTIDRMVRAGMPVERVTDDAPRFSRAAAEAWYRSRPVKPPREPKVLASSSASGPSDGEVDMAGVRPVGSGGKGGR